MKLGVITSLWAYAERLSVVDTLERIAALGLRHVDLLGILHGDPMTLSPSERKTIRKKLSSLDLILGSLVLLPPGNLASDDPDERDRCWEVVQAGIEMVAELGGKQVLFNGGKRAFGVPHDRSLANAVSFMRRASEYAQTSEVYITLEAEPYVYFLVNDLDTTCGMVKEVDHPHFMTTLDIGHMNLSRDAPETLERLKPWTLRIHLSENDGVLHANDILGTGTVELGSYLNTIENLRFEETCTQRGLELVAVMELGVLGQEIQDADEYARRSRDYVLQVAPFITC
jgi:sugar phosphate isomerase/epimerase